MSDALWITWENQIRNKSMSSALEIRLYEPIYSGSRFKRYIMGFVKTLQIIVREKPNILFVQNPSIVLTMYTLLLKGLFRYKLAIDAHYYGVVAPKGNTLFQVILNICNRNADMVIVTNYNHYKMIASLGGNPFICQDPLPDLDHYFSKFSDSNIQDKKVLFICSFDTDEPFQEVFKAFEELATEGYSLYVSGNYKKAGIRPVEFKHVHFLGYVSSKEFYWHMYTSSVVVDLTTYEDCLVCGAYESMVAEKPLVATGTRTIREYFTNGVIYTDINVKAVAEAIRKAYQERHRLVAEIQTWKPKAVIEHKNMIKEMKHILGLEC